MIENQKIRPAKVIGPLGEPLTIADLPSPKTKRWVVRRKAEVVAAVNGGLLTIDEVLERYNLTLESLPAGSAQSIVRACRDCVSPVSSIIVTSTSASSNIDSALVTGGKSASFLRFHSFGLFHGLL